MRALLVERTDHYHREVTRYAWVDQRMEEAWSGMYGSRARILTLVGADGQVSYLDVASNPGTIRVISGLPDNWTPADLLPVADELPG